MLCGAARGCSCLPEMIQLGWEKTCLLTGQKPGNSRSPLIFRTTRLCTGGFIMDTGASYLLILILIVSGILTGWLISTYFFMQKSDNLDRASEELKEETSKMRAYNIMTLEALEGTGIVELARDDSGNVMGLERIIKSSDSQISMSSDDSNLTVNPPIIENKDDIYE